MFALVFILGESIHFALGDTDNVADETGNGVELRINDTIVTDDDFVAIPFASDGNLDLSSLSSDYTDCMIRSTDHMAHHVTLLNKGSGTGAMYFGTPSSNSIQLDLPADQSWVHFTIFGKTASTQPFDGAIGVLEQLNQLLKKNVNVGGVDAGLMLTTIQDNPQWPGQRPATLLADLGYANAANPSDTQICIDVLTHADNPIMQPLTKQGIVDAAPWGGVIGPNYNAQDEKWLTLALLKRSVNPAPAQAYTMKEVADFPRVQNLVVVGTKGDLCDFRLLNKMIMIAGNIGGHPIAGPISSSEIGATPFEFQNGEVVDLFITVNHGKLHATFKAKATLGAALTVYADGNKADPNDHDNQTVFNADGTIMHRAAGRAGAMLEPAERYVDKDMYPPPFFNELKLNPPQHTFTYAASYDNQSTWPSADGYHFDATQKKYVRDSTLAQAADPFIGFLTHAIPWPAN